MDQLRQFGEAVDDEQKKNTYINRTAEALEKMGFAIAEVNYEKPWGGYIRIDNSQADEFIGTFFKDLPVEEARLGKGVEVSPKLLIVLPSQRLSWQYHGRRAERWTFLTPGGYYRSDTDDQGEMIEAEDGHSVQFQQGERHRLVGGEDGYTVVAEIWQHTDPNNPSDEDDIVRLQDDYMR
jgi:mannose-6-phosphate isomerase-like protein (cupin superfamily)